MTVSASGYMTILIDFVSEFLMIDKKASNILLKRATFTCGNDQTENFHDTADLIGKLGGHPEQSSARQHAGSPSARSV